METKCAARMEDQSLEPAEAAHTDRFSAVDVDGFVEKVDSSKLDNGEPAQHVPFKPQEGEHIDPTEQDYSNSDSLPSLVTSTISSTSIQERMDLFEHAIMTSLQKSVADITLNEAGEGTADRKVRFALGCNETPQPKEGQRMRGCCDEFMEQTISVHEIERIFDIDFDKEWVQLITSYRPWTAHSGDNYKLTPEELSLRKKVEKAEKRMRKRDEKIRRYTRKARNEEEENLLRREILQKMSEKAKKFMEKRRAQWEKQRQKEEQEKAKEAAKRMKAAEKYTEKKDLKTSEKKTRKASRAAGDAVRNSSDIS